LVSDETVRIRTDKLDALMGGVGELLVTRIGAQQRLTEVRALEARLTDWDSSWRNLGRHTQPTAGGKGAFSIADGSGLPLEAARRDLSELRRKLEADARRMAQLTADLHEDVRRTRMLPLSTVFGAFPRMVRRLARDRGKEVALSIAGGEIEVDRAVLGQIKDPLMHLLRNCVDHGIEAPEVRAGAGKPTAGTISVSASQRGDSLVVEVADDGSGVNVERVRTNAVKKGLLAQAAAAELSDREAISLIFRSGLSTSPVITDLSGRGVGLDVVREAVERLHGSVEVESRPRLGTTFSLSLPVSMSTMFCLLIEAGGGTFALPASSVERIIRVGPEETQRVEERETVRVDGFPVVLARLSDALGVKALSDSQSAPGQPVVVLGLQRRRAAFRVDRLRGTHELVIKSLPAPLLRVRHVTGATVVGAGEVALILSAADLMASLERSSRPTLAPASPPATEPATILVVEDSLTTRTLEKNILETAGYRVRVASDGAEALNLLQSSSCGLVVADIEMPRMDGFELTARIRADQRYRDLPVVLVTSRDSREDRERGTRVGADAYIVKRGFDQDRLLETIRRLI
jgi:two-component system chemotaxis sensor kinase CheA